LELIVKEQSNTLIPPFNRKLVGEKGVGRFAVDKLGERLADSHQSRFTQKK
jgi:hypothetical protein